MSQLKSRRWRRAEVSAAAEASDHPDLSITVPLDQRQRSQGKQQPYRKYREPASQIKEQNVSAQSGGLSALAYSL